MIEEGINPSHKPNITRVVVYHITPAKSNQTQRSLNPIEMNEMSGFDHGVKPPPGVAENVDNAYVKAFLENHHPKPDILEHHHETVEARRSTRWPALTQAIVACQQQEATLLIAELGTLASNESFTQLLLQSGVPFHCCDQPFVNQTILEALHKHAQVQKKLHGKLIREGLKLTSAKSGNPNAAEVINKVNKPKIDSAILFAFLLQPIIQDYKSKGYSQRQMVKALNDEGFTAPEGGRWVLSQLQKVLDRVRLNELAQRATSLLPDCRNKNLNATQIAHQLNEQSLPSLKRGGWDESQVEKLLHRVQQIEEISLINRFILQLLPVLRYSKTNNMTPQDMLSLFEKAQMAISPPSLVADLAI